MLGGGWLTIAMKTTPGPSIVGVIILLWRTSSVKSNSSLSGPKFNGLSKIMFLTSSELLLWLCYARLPGKEYLLIGELSVFNLKDLETNLWSANLWSSFVKDVKGGWMFSFSQHPPQKYKKKKRCFFGVYQPTFFESTGIHKTPRFNEFHQQIEN